MSLRGFTKLRSSIRSSPLSNRPFGSDGGALSDAERAGETTFIKKVEKEKLQKVQQGGKNEEPVESKSTPRSSFYSLPSSASDSSKNFAVLAGVTALVAGGWLWVQPNPAIDEKKK